MREASQRNNNKRNIHFHKAMTNMKGMQVRSASLMLWQQLRQKDENNSDHEHAAAGLGCGGPEGATTTTTAVSAAGEEM